jgi:glycine/D-amino acid oxidase-like deaminating enzyme
MYSKKINVFDIAIVGDGMNGSLAAVEISAALPNLKICWIGSNYNSGSRAAGAMHAVFGEVEEDFYNSQKNLDFLNIGLKSKKEWKNILKKYKIEKFITSKNTVFYMKKSDNEFEKSNFRMACNIASKYKILKNIQNKDKKKIFKGLLGSENFDAVTLKSEFSFNPVKVIESLNKISKRNVNLEKYHGAAQNITHSKNMFSLKIESKKLEKSIVIKAKKLVVASGYNSSKLVKNIFKAAPIIKGVGTAFLLKHKYFSKNFKQVVRTPNRGGTQCGLHIVPYGKNIIYVGAGNYLSNEAEPLGRIETINYLSRLLAEELLPRKIMYESQVINLLGYRPRSIDNMPSIGTIKKNNNIFYISGANRVGLSWSPYVIKQLMNWLNNKKIDKIFKNFKPDREIYSWGKHNDAIKYYSDSRLANLLEHNLINSKDKNTFNKKKKQLKNFSKIQNSYLIKKFKINKKFVFDPDCYGVLKNINLKKN